MKFLLVVLMVFGSLLITPRAVNIGDELFSLESSGMFYAFVTGAVHVIDPVQMKIVKNITDSDLPTNWGDVVYGETAGKYLLFASDRTNNRLIVIDTVNQTIVAKVPVGTGPLHNYFVQSENQVWVHLDGEGNFDVVNLNNICQAQAQNLGAATTAKHGKLLFEDDLVGIAYKTSTGDGGIFKFNLTELSVSGTNGTFFNFTDQAINVLNLTNTTCAGTHGISYSSVSKHLYVECSGKGVFEFDTVQEQLVAVWPTAVGQTYSTPDDEFIIVLNTNANAVHVFQATSNGVASTKQGDIYASKPSRHAFTPLNVTSDVSLSGANFSDWKAWFTSSANITGSGLGVSDLSQVLANSFAASNVTSVNSGEVAGSTRYVKAGGQWLAMNTDIPFKSVAVVNATNQTLIGFVPLPFSSATFFRIAWAPYRTSSQSNVTSCLPAPTAAPTTAAPTSTTAPTTAAPTTKKGAIGNSISLLMTILLMTILTFLAI